MAESSVSYFASLINEQIQAKENLTVCLAKLEALIVLAASSDFSELPKVTIHECLWAFNDYIHQAIELNGESLDTLLSAQRKDVLKNRGMGQ